MSGITPRGGREQRLRLLGAIGAVGAAVFAAAIHAPVPAGGATGTQRAAQPQVLTSGVYDVRITYRRSTVTYQSRWTLTVTGNRIRGRSDWPCCPGKRTDAITGKVDGSRVVMVRDCRGQGYTGACSQTYVLTASGGRFEGTYTGTASGAQPVVTMTAVKACAKTYVIRPSGAKVAANLKFVELTKKQIAGVIQKESLRYEGFDYTPIGSVTRKQNCAGYVMRSLFGAKVVRANVEPDGFFRKIVKPYGVKRLGRLTARKGDVVVYRDARGIVKHVAMVESNGVRMKILTKDGNERLYRATFPLGPLRLTNDPLVVAHADNGRGTVEFWRLDHSRVSIQAVSAGLCDLP